MSKHTMIFLLLSWACVGSAQDSLGTKKQGIHPFIGYELGEAVFNKFRSISGELGIRFPNEHMLRVTHMNVNLTEEHLSSSFASAVDGKDVEGEFFGFEAFYDLPVAWKGVYIGPSLGYYKNEYHHILLEESFRNETLTVGLGLSYRETDVFRIKGLYYTFSFPMRISLNPNEETKLGNTTISNNLFDNNIWLFIGFEF